jgi:hypothetical protein
MFQGDARPADLTERDGIFIRRDVREPGEIEVVRQLSEIAFLIHHRGIEEIVDGGSLEQGGFLEQLADRWQVLTSASAGWFE